MQDSGKSSLPDLELSELFQLVHEVIEAGLCLGIKPLPLASIIPQRCRDLR